VKTETILPAQVGFAETPSAVTKSLSVDLTKKNYLFSAYPDQTASQVLDNIKQNPKILPWKTFTYARDTSSLKKKN